MDLNSEKNLEMAEVLLSALNPAARATLWLKVVKSQKEISLKVALCRKILENFSNINITNHYPEQKI